MEWKARLNGFLHINSSEQARLETALHNKGISDSGRRRIRKTLQAIQNQRTQVLDIVAPLELEAMSFELSDPGNLLRNKLPKSQGLIGYYSNIFRDWAWNNGENETLIGPLRDLLVADQQKALGKCLTLGAGAGRLSYDLHREYKPELSVALDINPLLVFLASRVMAGEVVPLFEFPIAPIEESAVNQNCSAPQAIGCDEPFVFALGDGLNPPFKAASFDTVVTPWLVDVIPQNLSEFIPTINRLLTKGGVWLNTGSLAFFHQDESWRYTPAEVIDLLKENGFEVISTTRQTVPYLQSPLSGHGRTETLFSFSARKVEDVKSSVRYEYLPPWILDTKEPIPNLAEFLVASSNHLLQAQILAAVDGKRCVTEIGVLVAQKYGLDPKEATTAVKRILVDLYEVNKTHVN